MRRHDLVYLLPDSAFVTPCAEPGDEFWLAARQWINRGWPLVAARQPDASERRWLGLCLPAQQQRKKLAISVERSAIADIQPPLAVARCLSRLPAGQAAVLVRLADRAGECSARVGVYGSLAWEALTQETYRHGESDIDLICDIGNARQLAVMLAALQQAANALPCRLDGELRFPDGNAASWREVAGQLGRPGAQVLVKGPHEVGLMPLQALTGSLLPESCHA
jgi:phosphoribosyl-dephospho-CoA transferase